MVKTHAKKEVARQEKLEGLSKSERLRRTAIIKSKQGRVLNAAEKHARLMTGDLGAVLRLWEDLRKAASGGGGRRSEATAAIVGDMWTHIEPSFDLHIRTPRVSRMLQSLLKYGSDEQVEMLVTRLLQKLAVYATDAFSRFVIFAALRHGNREQHERILRCIAASAPHLVTHAFGVEVLHTAYVSKRTSASERDQLVVGVLKACRVSAMKHWPGYPVLEDMICDNERKPRILKALGGFLDKLTSGKEAHAYPIVQRLCSAYVHEGPKHEVHDLLENILPQTVAMSETREGALLAARAVSLAPPSARRDVLRWVHQRGVVELACGRYSAAFVARLCDVTYDAQLLHKHIVAPLAAAMDAMLSSPSGHLVVLHLVTPLGAALEAQAPKWWAAFDLYARESTTWNVHRFLDETEEVQIVPRRAEETFLRILPDVVAAIVAAVGRIEGGSDAWHFARVVVRELLRITAEDAAYRRAVEGVLGKDVRSGLEKFAAQRPFKERNAKRNREE